MTFDQIVAVVALTLGAAAAAVLLADLGGRLVDRMWARDGDEHAQYRVSVGVTDGVTGLSVYVPNTSTRRVMSAALADAGMYGPSRQDIVHLFDPTGFLPEHEL